MSTNAVPPTVADVVAELERRYPPAWAEDWDRVGLVLGEPCAPVRRVLCVVDVVPETVAEALDAGVDMIVAHHPLLLRGVSSVAPTTFKGRIVHRLIKSDVALYVAHTNADVAAPGVSDALAARFGLTGLRPLHRPAPGSPAHGDGRGIGRIGELPEPMTLAELTRHAAAVLPATAWGVRAAGDPGRMVRTLAVSGGAGTASSPTRPRPGWTRSSPPTCATTRPASTWPPTARPCSTPPTGRRNDRGWTTWPSSCGRRRVSRRWCPTWPPTRGPYTPPHPRWTTRSPEREG